MFSLAGYNGLYDAAMLRCYRSKPSIASPQLRIWPDINELHLVNNVICRLAVSKFDRAAFCLGDEIVEQLKCMYCPHG